MQGLIFVYGFSLLGVLIYLMWLKVLRFDIRWGSFPKGFRSSFIQFSLITFLATAASTLIMKIDSIMVSSMISLEANAIYTIAFSMALVIELPRRAISQVVMPVVADHFAKDNLSEINVLYKQVSNRQLYVCILLFIGIWANIDAIYSFVPNKEIYLTGKWVVFLIGLGKLFDVAFSINSEILVFSKYYRFNLFLTIIMSALIIVLNYLMIPIYGIEGAAGASAIVMLLFNVVKYLFLKMKLGLEPFSKETLKILGVGILTFSSARFTSLEGSAFAQLIFTSFFVFAYFLMWSLIFRAGREEWLWIKERIKKSGS
jgi:O-antigen/teichoic acid export membrane protein